MGKHVHHLVASSDQQVECTKALTKTTNCICRVKKVEGATKKCGSLSRTCAPLHFQIRSLATPRRTSCTPALTVTHSTAAAAVAACGSKCMMPLFFQLLPKTKTENYETGSSEDITWQRLAITGKWADLQMAAQRRIRHPGTVARDRKCWTD